MMVADDRGREIMLMRTSDGWRRRESRRDEWVSRVRWTEWTDGASERDSTFAELEYDPRTRPWYLGALALDAAVNQPRGPIHWTEPYTFFTTKDPGITASVVFVAPDGRRHVIGFDILLSDIAEFTSSLAVTEHGGAAVTTEDLRLVGVPRNERFSDPAARRAALLERPVDLGWALATDAAAAFGPATAARPEPVRFASDGATWWGAVQPFALGADRALRIFILVPEHDLLGNVKAQRNWIIGITLAALVAALVQAGVLARRYSRPIEALVRESDRISRGQLEEASAITSSVTEVRRLADAHDRMRLGLLSLMKMERDLQLARQIQQSALPERLPTLSGYDIEAWSEPAEETGGDTYDIIGFSRSDNGDIVISDDDATHGLLLMADATGHGIGPALTVTQLRAMIRMATRGGGAFTDVVRHINQQLCVDLPSGLFITAWIAVINTLDHTLTSFSAGQGPLLRYDAARREVTEIETDTLPFGVMEDLDIPELRPTPMARGDMVAVISDGIFEAADGSGAQFGKQRTVELLQTAHDRPLVEIIERLRDEVEAFTGGRPADDDRTIVLLRRG
jgi:serine phosphatase RsbU (regulator of sigma subunit)